MAKKKKKSEFLGVGCLIEAVGLVLLFLFPIGTIIGVILLVVGSRYSYKYVCSECGNKVEKTSKICPHCNVKFDEK